MAEVKGLGVPIVRYPGGNFVSGYNWLDGVGPKNQRPTVLDRAWNTLEPNQFGTNEFIQWARLVDAEPLLGGDFGTGTVAEQVALVEYCNVAGAPSGANCDGRTASRNRTTSGTGAWATRWTGLGRWAQ
jgi:alpha-N-arabinofuranosidase